MGRGWRAAVEEWGGQKQTAYSRTRQEPFIPQVGSTVDRIITSASGRCGRRGRPLAPAPSVRCGLWLQGCSGQGQGQAGSQPRDRDRHACPCPAVLRLGPSEAVEADIGLPVTLDIQCGGSRGGGAGSDALTTSSGFGCRV